MVTVPAQVDLGNADINAFTRMRFQEILQGFPSLQTAGISVTFPGNIDGPWPGTFYRRGWPAPRVTEEMLLGAIEVSASATE